VPRRRAVEEPEGILPVVTGDLAELVQDPLLEGQGGLAVASMDSTQVFPFGLVAHDVTLLSSTGCKGYILNGAMIDPRVTF
jgi:hypothetical protein